MSFYKAMGTQIPDAHLERRMDMTYISWATAVAMAGRPKQDIVSFDGKPVASVFGGALVAVDMSLPNGKIQRTYLPALDNRNEPIAAEAITARDITDTIARCRAKAVAMVTGHGMSLYAGYEGNGPQFAHDMGLKPAGDPAAVQAIVSKKKVNRRGDTVDYLDWACALCAARITDENFHWEVQEHELRTQQGEIKKALYLPLAKGFLVTVTVTWKGDTHTEMLPIMGAGNAAISQPTVADWNKTVMRCLAKAIAVDTGYGLSLYAKEDVSGYADPPDPSQMSEQNQGSSFAEASHATRVAIDAAASRAQRPVAPRKEPTGIDAFFGGSSISNRSSDLATQVKDLLREKNQSSERLLTWLGFPVTTALDDLPDGVLRRAITALQATGVKVAA